MRFHMRIVSKVVEKSKEAESLPISLVPPLRR
jgi:hypothetical protein